MALARGSKYNDPERASKRSSQVIGRISAIDGEAVIVHQERCAKVRNRNVSCLKCAAACTSGCISYAHNELSVDPELCVGCGTCATVCPTCCLEAHNPSDSELLHACMAARFYADDGSNCVVIACHPALLALEGLYRKESVVEVVCAGRVEESLLCTLRSRGVDRVSVLCGVCEMCKQRQGRHTVELVSKTCETLLAAWDLPPLVDVADRPPAEVLASGVTVQAAAGALKGYFSVERANIPIRSLSFDSDTGDLLDTIPEDVGLCDAGDPTGGSAHMDVEVKTEKGGSCVSSLEEAFAYQKDPISSESGTDHDRTNSVDFIPDEPKIEQGLHFSGSRNSKNDRQTLRETLHVMKDGTLPHFVPDRRERLLDAFSVLGKPQTDSISCRLWGYAEIDSSKCLSCRMCATFCPTGAISKFDGETFGIDHYPIDCVKCKSCFDICPGSAITIRDETSLDDLLSGRSHRFEMTPRDVPLFNNPHQIQETMRSLMDCDVFER